MHSDAEPVSSSHEISQFLPPLTAMDLSKYLYLPPEHNCSTLSRLLHLLRQLNFCLGMDQGCGMNKGWCNLQIFYLIYIPVKMIYFVSEPPEPLLNPALFVSFQGNSNFTTTSLQRNINFKMEKNLGIWTSV